MQNKVLKIEEIKKLGELLLGKIENTSNKLVLFEQTYSKNKYKAYFLQENEAVVNKLVKKSVENILALLPKRNICKYQFDISEEAVIQTIDEKDVINGKIILDDMAITDNLKFVDDKTNFDKFKFAVLDIALEIDEKKERVVLFKKYHQPAATFKESYKYVITGKIMKEIIKPILSFDSQVDAFFYKNTYYVINRNSFNSIFKFKDLFIKVVDNNIEAIKALEILQDEDGFIDICKNDGRYLPRVTKAILAKSFETCKTNIDKIPQIIASRNLSIKLTKDNRIAYSDKIGVKEVLDLLLEHYVISELTNEKLIAIAIEKYDK